ncbi:serine/threonine-protein kinase [Streptomyces sp. NPDC005202]|uniref:serine/threonine-protein kinase n=1 Tax=Streptomyces sp. NPDC005202 TaxID=3157021 RepID=UPI0033ACACF6
MDALKAQDPARIGAYTLLARLGAGGMGQVYLGRSPGGRLVALKVIRDEITDHPEALARFRREVETARAVRSAYTANLIDASLDTAPYWLATGYVAGPTLSRAVAERGPLPAATCRGLFAALAEGLAAVHAHGVTHRDLKPQNVILAAQGPQLIDPDTEKPVEGLLSDNPNVGYTSKPLDLYGGDDPSAWKYVTYPDDFHTWINGRPRPSIPPANDPGDWTVEFHHIRTPDDYKSVMCVGFRVK